MKDKDFWENYEPLLDGLNKEKIINFYYEFKNFFGNRLGEFINLEYGYDVWFVDNVIIPERRSFLRTKILEFLKCPSPITNKILSSASKSTLDRLSFFYNSHDQNENEVLNFVVNATFFVENYKSHLETLNSDITDVDYFLNLFLDNPSLILSSFDNLNSFLSVEDSESIIDVFKKNKNILKLSLKLKYMK